MREREILIAALRFYADPVHWQDGGFEFEGTAISLILSTIDKDQGEVARKTLKELLNEGEKK